ncbi:MAG: hypothetical protein V4486_01665 [Patescibacteria group bacterium]
MPEFSPDSNLNSEKIKENPVQKIFSLTPQETLELKDRIEKNNGIVRIMVHPYYIAQKKMDDPDVLEYYHLERIPTVERGFEKILKTKSQTPTILFESYDMVNRTKHIIEPILKKASNQIYLVETHPADPLPYFGSSPETEGQEWALFIEKLKTLGVKRIIVGGMNLWTDPLNTTGDLEGCVGRTIDVLRNHFEVQTSSLASPDSRKNFKKPDNFEMK